MAYEVRLTDSATEELRAIRVFDRRWIVDEIKRQLRDEPTVSTRNRKCLHVAVPEFEHVPPVWELRVGDYRVFYDVEEPSQTVYVRAVHRKQPGQATEEIIHEGSDN